MKSDWEEVRLGEVIAYRKNFITIDDEQIYKLCRVQTNTKGVVLRECKIGFEIKTKSQQVCQAGDFIVAEMDARFGGYGMIPPELEGSIVSSHYFLYDVDEECIDRNYLDFYSQTPAFFSQVEAKGSTNYAAVRPTQILNFTIPLPPPTEQQRIVAKLDAVKAKLAEVERLRAQQSKDVKALLFKQYTSLIENAEWLPMREVAPITRRPVEIDPDQQYPELGIRSFGKGTFHKLPMKGSDLTWQKPFWLKTGDLVFSNIKAWEGAVAVVKPEDDGRVGSHRYISCVPDPSITFADFLFYYFQTPDGNEKLNAASPGSADRNRTLNTKKLADTLIPIPSLTEQAEFLALRAKLGQIQRLHAQSEVQLGQLMPSLLAQAFGD